MILALYVSNINPGYLKFDADGTHKIKGPLRITLDLVFHVLPFVFIFVKYWQYYRTRLLSISTSNALLILLIYIVVFDPILVYDVHGNSIIYLILITLVSFLVFVNKTKQA
jgi:hypothetical protein